VHKAQIRGKKIKNKRILRIYQGNGKIRIGNWGKFKAEPGLIH